MGNDSAYKQKKKPRNITRIVLIVLLLFIIAVAIFVYLRWPRYPAFEKKLTSFGALEKALSGEENLVLTDLDNLGYEEVQYYLKLDGRDLLSKKLGYYVYGNASLLGKKMDGSVVAEPETGSSPSNDGDLQYRGIGISVLESSSATKHWIEQMFILDGFEYRLFNSYSPEGLDLGEITIMDTALQEKQTLLTHLIIDKALDGLEYEYRPLQ